MKRDYNKNKKYSNITGFDQDIAKLIEDFVLPITSPKSRKKYHRGSNKRGLKVLHNLYMWIGLMRFK